jgi:hypothetical protein
MSKCELGKPRNSSKDSLGLAFRENRECVPDPMPLGNWDKKATNNNIAKVKTGFGINSSEWDEIVGGVGNPYDGPKTPPQAKPDGATVV